MIQGNAHIIGICGIGMSGIAQFLLKMGCYVQGSDENCNSGITHQILASKNIKIFTSHSTDNIRNVDFVIKSNAISCNNAEIAEAKRLGKKIFTRTEILQQILQGKKVIAISGCHGKTTTTAMLAEIFIHAGINPNVICGGIINGIGNNVNITDGDIFIVEADESDDTFFSIPVNLGIITNIGEDHLEFHENLSSIREKFGKFVGKSEIAFIPYSERMHFNSANIAFYDADEIGKGRLSLINHTGCQTYFKYKVSDYFDNFNLNAVGEFNIKNAIAAIALSYYFGIDLNVIKSALAKFSGVKRRLSIIGEFQGSKVVDDYAHHPYEIYNAIKAISDISGKNVVAVVQPHRYSRLRCFFSDYLKSFIGARYVILLPVYGAGEDHDEEFNNTSLYHESVKSGYKNICIVNNFNEMRVKIIEILSPTDTILFVGAGNITDCAHGLVTR